MNAEHIPPMPLELADTLSIACPTCAHAFGIGPSLMMRLGVNSGHCTCPGCKTFLHVEATGSGTASGEPWDDYAKRVHPDAQQTEPPL